MLTFLQNIKFCFFVKVFYLCTVKPLNKDIMKEEWKAVVEYEGLYEVSNMGRVRSLKFGKAKELCPANNGLGYLFVGLCKGGKSQTKLIHRLVAEAFIPNPDNLPCVNHKDEVKTNNRVSNLEWCTQSYNLEYSNIHKKAIAKQFWEKGNAVTRKPISQFTKDGQFLREFESIMDASRQTGVDIASISRCCLGSRKSAGGFVWRFKI